MRARCAVSCQHGAAQGEWQREDGVLPFDHLQSGIEILPEGHGSIVKEDSDLTGRVLRDMGIQFTSRFQRPQVYRQL